MDPAAFAARCRDARLKGVWIRVGRGTNRDPNLGFAQLGAIRTELASVGVQLWGWHVPFCANLVAAAAEADRVLSWADDAKLDGIVVDAEQTPESPRFQGDEAEAVGYLRPLTRGLEAAGRGVAFSSHDQPSLHRDMPFQPFLDIIEDVCPQVDRMAGISARNPGANGNLPASRLVGQELSTHPAPGPQWLERFSREGSTQFRQPQTRRRAGHFARRG
jgi:hypothetical protein